MVFTNDYAEKDKYNEIHFAQRGDLIQGGVT